MEPPGAFLTLLGGVIAVIPVVSLAVSDPLPPNELVALAIGFAFGAAVLTVSAWGVVGTSDLPGPWMERAVLWAVGGVALFTSIVGFIIAVGPAESPSTVINYGSLGASLGCATGVLVGTIEARSIHRARESARLTAETARATAERQRLDQLNAILRHEVLNGVNIIQGQADMVAERCRDRPDVHHGLETVQRRADRIAETVSAVRVLINTVTDEVDLDSYDLSRVILDEAGDISAAHPSATITVSSQEPVTVQADEMLPRVFSNLLSNAIEHNDSAHPEVTVRMERESEWIAVRVTDNGPGIPPDKRAKLFDRNRGDHGIGLHLVRSLVERYGGTIDLLETGRDGTTFTVWLPIHAAAGSTGNETRDTLEESAIPA